VRRFPVSPRRGQTVFFDITVKNQGTAPTPSGMPLRAALSIGGTNLVWSDNFAEALPPDASVVLTCNAGVTGPGWIAAGGSHTLRAWVDDQEQIVESGETNNIFTMPLIVNNAADTDGDGHDDVVENAVGTDPMNPNSVFRMMSIIRGGTNHVTLTWASVSNRTYRVACKGDAGEIVWTDLTGAIRATNSTTTWSTNLPDATRRVFFKVRTP
jgi:hypothetical protein